MTVADAELSRYYATRAREYEQIYDKPERQADLARLQRAIAAYFVDRDVLEIACGTGYWTQFIAPVARSVTATDINAETLAIAETKPFPPDRVRLAVADIYDLPPEYKNFSGAFAGFWWSHLRRAHRRSVIATLHRALKPAAIRVALGTRHV